MSFKTTALVHRGPDESSKLETVTVEAIGDDEALVAIEATGVCHTDLSCMKGLVPGLLPCVFGHEGAGRVVSTGANVTHVKKGDKVLLSYALCGKCEQCKDGHPAYCLEFPQRNFGGKRTDGSTGITGADGSGLNHNFFGQSSFMKQAVVHKNGICPVPEDTNLEKFAALGCGFMTGAGCVFNTLDVKEGSTLAVFGCGGVGMASIMAGAIRKAGKVIAIDLQESRLKLAKEVGATHTIDGKAEDLIKQIQELCPPNGVNFAIDTTGVPQVVSNMVDALGTRGKAASIGAPPMGTRAPIDIFAHLIQGKEYVGCTEGDAIPSEFVPYILEEYKKGNFPVDKLISYYHYTDFEKAFKDSAEGRTVKAVLRWD